MSMVEATQNENIDLLIVGAGPAGLAAAVEAQRAGISNLLVVAIHRAKLSCQEVT